MSIVVTGGAAARGRSAVTLMVSSRVTPVLSVRVAAVSTDCASAVPATRASAARALRARIVVCSPARPRGGGRRQVLLSWSRRAGRMPGGGGQTMGAGGACANGSACGVGVDRDVGGTAGSLERRAARITCSPPRVVGAGSVQMGAADVDDAGLTAGRHVVVAARGGGAVLALIRDARLPGTAGHRAARGRDEREARGDDGGDERADQRFQHGAPAGGNEQSERRSIAAQCPERGAPRRSPAGRRAA